MGKTLIAGPITYLIDEGFEGEDTPVTGWRDVEYGGTITWHSTDRCHDGTKSLKLDSATESAQAEVASPTMTYTGTIYGKFWVWFDHVPNAVYGGFSLHLHTDGTGDPGHVTQNTDGALRVVTRNGTAYNTTEAMPINTWIRIWWSYTPGAGNATLKAWWSTNDVHPGDSSSDHYVISDDGSDNVTIGILEPSADYAGTVHGLAYFDDIKTSMRKLW